MSDGVWQPKSYYFLLSLQFHTPTVPPHHLEPFINIFPQRDLLSSNLPAPDQSLAFPRTLNSPRRHLGKLVACNIDVRYQTERSSVNRKRNVIAARANHSTLLRREYHLRAKRNLHSVDFRKREVAAADGVAWISRNFETEWSLVYLISSFDGRACILESCSVWF